MALDYVAASRINRSKKAAFAVGADRYGTKFLHQLLTLEEKVASSHERNPLNEAFHCYCKWYEMPIDHEGFLQTKGEEIQQDWHQSSLSFEASSYLSWSINELYDRFKSKFILIVSRPDRLINTYLGQGWYEQPFVRDQADRPPSFHGCSKFHQFLARIAPSGRFYGHWSRMSRIGKLAWYWNTLNASVIDQFRSLPKRYYKIVRIEDFTYDKYLEIATLLGFKPTISRQEFLQMEPLPVGLETEQPLLSSWSSTEICEFEREVAPMAETLGYEYRVDQLLSESQWPTDLAANIA